MYSGYDYVTGYRMSVEEMQAILKKNSGYDFLFFVQTLFHNYFSEINTNGNDEWF